MVSTSLLEVVPDKKTAGRQKMSKMEEPDFHSRNVQCRCPKCGKIHSLKFLWTGTGIPRKFCHRCRESISGVNDALVYEASPNIFVDCSSTEVAE